MSRVSVSHFCVYEIWVIGKLEECTQTAENNILMTVKIDFDKYNSPLVYS